MVGSGAMGIKSSVDSVTRIMNLESEDSMYPLHRKLVRQCGSNVWSCASEKTWQRRSTDINRTPAQSNDQRQGDELHALAILHSTLSPCLRTITKRENEPTSHETYYHITPSPSAALSPFQLPLWH
jgi:hypothetical protein